MSTVADQLRAAEQALRDAGIESAGIDSELLVGSVLGYDRAQLRTRSDSVVSSDDANAINALIQRRSNREPVQYILGRAPFRTIELAVDKRVLIPRPETEAIVDIALAHAAELHRNDPQYEVRIVDTCTGSGAIPIALAVELQTGPATIAGIDLSVDAMEVAARNVGDLGVDVELMSGSLLAPVADRTFDIVTANPPYVAQADRDSLPRDVRDFEPEVALFLPGDDPNALVTVLARESISVLVPGGILVVEIGMGQANDVAACFEGIGFADVAVHDDLQGIGRLVFGRRP